MRRRDFLVVIAGLGLCAPLAAWTAGKVPRIGYLVLSPLVDPPSPERVAFFEGLRELGYIEGENVVIEYRSAEGDLEMLPFRAAELAESKVDVIVAFGSHPAQAAREATATIPIVMAFGPDPVQLGLIKSLARPGTNVTGMSHISPELGAKRLELLKEALPSIKRVVVLWDSSNRSTVSEFKAVQAAARLLGITLQSVDVAGAPDLSRAFDLIDQHPPDALLVINHLRLVAYREIIAEFAHARRLPTMFGNRDFVASGGLMSYAPSFPDLTRRATTYVDKILKGAKPADLPVQQPTKFEFVINLRTAKALGIKIPPALLLRADEVIR